MNTTIIWGFVIGYMIYGTCAEAADITRDMKPNRIGEHFLCWVVAIARCSLAGFLNAGMCTAVYMALESFK